MSAARPLPVAIERVTFAATVAHFEMSDDSMAGAGALRGDAAVVLLNSDVQGGDLVLAHLPGEPLRILQYHAAPGDRVKFRTLQFHKSRRWVCKREDAVILGRVLQFQWMGRAVQTLVELRPVC